MEKVIYNAKLCADANSREVGAMLTAYIEAVITLDATRTKAAEAALRIVLVAQAAGHEAGAHDGATFKARCEAAQAALDAWPKAPAFRAYVQVGARRIGTNDAQLLNALDYDMPHANDETHTARPMTGFRNGALAELATALSEGLDGEDAMLRAVALRRSNRERGPDAAALAKHEDARLHTARVERQAAILRALAAGVPKSDIDKVVR